MSRPKQRTRDTKTTTISLENEVHRKLKHLAVDRDISVRELVREVIEDYLAQYEKDKAPINSLRMR
jgi:predicted transcriptional regulator